MGPNSCAARTALAEATYDRSTRPNYPNCLRYSALSKCPCDEAISPSAPICHTSKPLIRTGFPVPPGPVFVPTSPPDIISNVQNGPNGPLSYNLGNGLSGVYTYDSLGRIGGGWTCLNSTQTFCSGGTQIYGNTLWWSGVRAEAPCDTVVNQCATLGYDEFNRLTSKTVNSGETAQNFTYVYDRWGNRWQQNVTAGSGPQPQLSFNTSTNHITNSGFAYDAAGNMTNDGYHTYTYDAEGSITAVDGGATAQYTYNALNQRVESIVGSTKTEYFYNANGQRDTIWNGNTGAQFQGQYYWGAKPVAFYYNDNKTHFQHQDWLGTERIRTSYNGATEATFTSLPFGDGQTTTGSDQDPYHFATLDSDPETLTDHAQFRQYSPAQGRWMRPDPYTGSYDPSNPQSFNRYTYVLNNPLSYLDPSGLDCQSRDTGESDDSDCGGDGTDNGGDNYVGSGWSSGGGSTPDPSLPSFSLPPVDSWFCGLSCDPLMQLAYFGSTPGLSSTYSFWGGMGGGGGGGSASAPNNGRNCSASPASAGQYAISSAAVAGMTAEFFSGIGAQDRTFGPDSSVSAVMAQSAGVQYALNEYYMTGATQDLYTFGAPGYVNAGANPVAQFVGSFRWSISGGILSLTNTTSFKSLTYDKGPQWGRYTQYPGAGIPMGNTHQTYNISVTCH